MNELLSLPSQLLSNDLLTFLSLRDIGRLDSALTNHLLRPQLFEVYRFLSVKHAKKGLDSCQMGWFGDRDISLESITFKKSIYGGELTTIFDMLQKSSRAGDVKNINCSKCNESPSKAHYAIISKHCNRVQSVNFFRCSGITKPMITQLCKRCPNLQSLDISNTRATDKTLMGLAQNCPTLVNLSVRACEDITDEAVITLARSCHSLASLDLNSSCNKVTDIGVSAIAENCPLMTSLDLSDCRNVSNIAVIALALNCKSLNTLKLSGCKNITDAAVITLAQNCPLLSVLHFRHCRELTDATLMVLSQNCPKLSSLDLSSCDRITDAGVVAVVKKCPCLTTLDLSYCREITDATVIALAENCPSLVTVNLSFCHHITAASVTALAENCPLLETLFHVGCENISKNVAETILSLGFCPHDVMLTKRSTN